MPTERQPLLPKARRRPSPRLVIAFAGLGLVLVAAALVSSSHDVSPTVSELLGLRHGSYPRPNPLTAPVPTGIREYWYWHAKRMCDHRNWLKHLDDWYPSQDNCTEGHLQQWVDDVLGSANGGAPPGGSVPTVDSTQRGAYWSEATSRSCLHWIWLAETFYNTTLLTCNEGNVEAISRALTNEKTPYLGSTTKPQDEVLLICEHTPKMRNLIILKTDWPTYQAKGDTEGTCWPEPVSIKLQAGGVIVSGIGYDALSDTGAPIALGAMTISFTGSDGIAHTTSNKIENTATKIAEYEIRLSYGTYKVEASASGFEKYVLDTFSVYPDTENLLDIPLMQPNTAWGCIVLTWNFRGKPVSGAGQGGNAGRYPYTDTQTGVTTKTGAPLDLDLFLRTPKPPSSSIQELSYKTSTRCQTSKTGISGYRKCLYRNKYWNAWLAQDVKIEGGPETICINSLEIDGSYQVWAQVPDADSYGKADVNDVGVISGFAYMELLTPNDKVTKRTWIAGDPAGGPFSPATTIHAEGKYWHPFNIVVSGGAITDVVTASDMTGVPYN